jgi:hypothetical protein
MLVQVFGGLLRNPAGMPFWRFSRRPPGAKVYFRLTFSTSGRFCDEPPTMNV